MSDDDGNGELFTSFAEAMSTLDRLGKIESKLAAAISNSKVPWKETRRLLKCSTTVEMSNTPLFQFMQALFEQIGLGGLEVAEVQHFKFVFVIKKPVITGIYPTVEGKKTCYIVADALSQFFSRDLSLPNTTEETRCTKAGDEHCQFKVELQPLAVYQLALDDMDKQIIGEIQNSKPTREKLAESLKLMEDELGYRLDVLRSYKILDENDSITEIGTTYYKYGHGPLRDAEEDFEPPWKAMSELSGLIAPSTSFAEAFTEAADDEPLWDVDENEVINLAEEAKKSKSFAELLAKQLKTDK